MTIEEFRDLLRDHADEIRGAYADRWPRMMRKEAVEHYREGFRQGGFTDTSLERWDKTRRQDVPFNGSLGKYGPLQSRSNDMMSSIDGRTEPGAVVIFSDSDHARYHNEGATATVTARMRKYFWARHAEAKRHYGKDNAETEFWRNMALIRSAQIHIPKRKFIGASATLMKRIEDVIRRDIERILRGDS